MNANPVDPSAVSCLCGEAMRASELAGRYVCPNEDDAAHAARLERALADLRGPVPFLPNDDRDSGVLLVVAQGVDVEPIDWSRVPPHPALEQLAEVCKCGAERGDHLARFPFAGGDGSTCKAFRRVTAEEVGALLSRSTLGGLVEPSVCPNRDQAAGVESGPGFAMAMPCPLCGTIHHGGAK